ncbi:MAG: HNH endonuclease signature motif containing protein [Bacteriovoracaceae bacterium]|nr:HNH endonuclease signature motif containing protein [Bacteriovoracaceae bacterium]
MKRWIWLVLSFTFLAQSTFARDFDLWDDGIVNVPLIPNSSLTPGHLCSKTNEDFDEFRYRAHIAHCARNVSKEDRAKIYDQYKIPKKCRQQYTIDHFIPLSIGGSNSPQNLWPEHKEIKLTRFHFEEEIMLEVQSGELTQAEAVAKVREVKLNPDLSGINSRNSDECNKFVIIQTGN